MNLSHLLSHITAMIEAAHPKPVVAPVAPPRLCRALLGVDDGKTEFGRAFELGPNKEQGWGCRALRSGEHIISMTQLGNVPMVLRCVSCQGIAVLSGTALKIRFAANCGDEITLSVRALDDPI